MTKDEWVAELKLIALKRKRATWELAWHLAAGERHDPDFKTAGEITEYSRAHLWNLYRVGRAFPREKAHPDLSFGAHRELLRENDEVTRTIVFSQAIEERWTCEQVRQYFEIHKPTAQTSHQSRKQMRARQQYVGAHVQCPNCAHVFEVRGNKAPRPREEPHAEG